MRPVIGILLVGICVMFLRLYENACAREDYQRGFWLKGLTALCFVLTGALFYSLCQNTAYRLLVFLGLMFGILGDQLLALRPLWRKRSAGMLALGGTSFACGHGCYIAAYLSAGARWIPSIGIGLLGWLLSLVYIKRRRVQAGIFQPLWTIYLAVVCLMMGAAWSCAFAQPGLRVLLGLAGVLFAVSDNLICSSEFGTEEGAWVHPAIHFTYFGAQLLIAWSLYYL